MVMRPDLMPKVSWMTLTTGARQLVVQLAFETILWLFSSLPLLTPRTTVMSSSLAGAEIRTRLAPASASAACGLPDLVAQHAPHHQFFSYKRQDRPIASQLLTDHLLYFVCFFL